MTHRSRSTDPRGHRCSGTPDASHPCAGETSWRSGSRTWSTCTSAAARRTRTGLSTGRGARGRGAGRATGSSRRSSTAPARGSRASASARGTAWPSSPTTGSSGRSRRTRRTASRRRSSRCTRPSEPRSGRSFSGDCGARVAIVATNTLRDEVAAMSLPELTHIVGLERPQSDLTSWAAMLAAGGGAPVPARLPASDVIADIIYTSGTTGKPKGALLSHENIVSCINAIHQIFPLVPDDRSLSFLPWAHVYGQVCEVHGIPQHGLLVGAERRHREPLAEPRGGEADDSLRGPAHLQPDLRGGEPADRPAARLPAADDPRGDRGSITRVRTASTSGAWRRVELALDEKLVFAKIRERLGGRLKYAITGSATLGREVAELIDALGHPRLRSIRAHGDERARLRLTSLARADAASAAWGASSPACVSSSTAPSRRRPEAGRDCRLRPQRDGRLPSRPEENEKALTKDGGLRTGDLGYVDEDGFLYITGRIKEQYKLENGKYVMPSPLEEELKLSPYLANVMIRGDGRPFNVALVTLDVARVREWAAAAGVTLAEDLAQDRTRPGASPRGDCGPRERLQAVREAARLRHRHRGLHDGERPPHADAEGQEARRDGALWCLAQGTL